MNYHNVEFEAAYGLHQQIPLSKLPEVAFSGRSNVGKSSLINRLLGRKALARVSSEPGKTVTINFYNLDGQLHVVDLPGYGYAKRTFEDKKRWSALTDGFFTANKNIDSLRLVCQLIDSRTGPTEDDLDMLYYMRESDLPHIIVATKTDKLNATEKNAFDKMIAENDLTRGLPLIKYSSKTNRGRDELWKKIYEYFNL